MKITNVAEDTRRFRHAGKWNHLEPGESVEIDGSPTLPDCFKAEGKKSKSKKDKEE